MTTEKQIAANRENARLSTGPRTEAGKAAPSTNAVKHGLTGRFVILPGQQEAFDELEAGLRGSLLPSGRFRNSSSAEPSPPPGTSTAAKKPRPTAIASCANLDSIPW